MFCYVNLESYREITEHHASILTPFLSLDESMWVLQVGLKAKGFETFIPEESLEGIILKQS